MRRPSEADLATIEYLESCRWPGKRICPFCNKSDSTLIPTRGLFQCNHCRKQFGVFTGTRFQGTRLSPFNLALIIITFWDESLKLGTNRRISLRPLIRILADKDLNLAYSTAQRIYKKIDADLIAHLEKYIKKLLS